MGRNALGPELAPAPPPAAPTTTGAEIDHITETQSDETQSVSLRSFSRKVDTDVSVMAHSWHIRVRLWTFALVRRFADLPFSSAIVRRVALDDFPKLSTAYDPTITSDDAWPTFAAGKSKWGPVLRAFCELDPGDQIGAD